MKASSARKILGPVATEFTAMKTGSWRIDRPVVDMAACISCGTCERYCPTNVITVAKKPSASVKFDYDYCKGCGICAEVCPKKCIRMVPEEGGKA